MAARMYTLYQKQNNKWVRLSNFSYTKQTAIRVFQSALINGCMSGSPELRLRPVKDNEVVGQMIH